MSTMKKNKTETWEGKCWGWGCHFKQGGQEVVIFEQRFAEGEHVSHVRYPREALGNNHKALKFHGDGEYTFTRVLVKCILSYVHIF